ncbi:iron dicitrate transporter FecR [Steroidobacter agaridevorans]|uniref:Iron dicitrate transporter FecR n=2 Tax=Steroidobacter agaridevorans TaxID=2695856 RepID=A0A829YB43_9GAMM|nr:iron dicitrate transporter FecR [Steroidobacter agaridevorans]
MAERETSQSVDRAAADWVARLDRAPLSDEDIEQLEQWLAGDPRRHGALLRARAMWDYSDMGSALGPQYDPASFERKTSQIPEEKSPPQVTGRGRRPLAWLGAMAASVILTLSLTLTVEMPKAYATTLGQIQLVPLDDGSTITLNTATEVSVQYQDRQRRVRLSHGEAYFEVTADPNRPFVVEVDERRVHASKAAFVVRKLGDTHTEVIVQSGHIELSASPDDDARTTLAANSRVSLPPSAVKGNILVDRIAPDQLLRDLAWRQGKLAFQGETLAMAASAFARYSDVHIVVADPALAREPVTGLFVANDPAGFSRAVAQVFDAKLERTETEIVLTRTY